MWWEWNASKTETGRLIRCKKESQSNCKRKKAEMSFCEWKWNYERLALVPVLHPGFQQNISFMAWFPSLFFGKCLPSFLPLRPFFCLFLSLPPYPHHYGWVSIPGESLLHILITFSFSRRPFAKKAFAFFLAFPAGFFPCLLWSLLQAPGYFLSCLQVYVICRVVYTLHVDIFHACCSWTGKLSVT